MEEENGLLKKSVRHRRWDHGVSISITVPTHGYTVGIGTRPGSMKKGEATFKKIEAKLEKLSGIGKITYA